MKTPVTVQLPTEISYWGPTATEADVERIHDNLESMIRSEFGERIKLRFERIENPRGSGVHSDDCALSEEVHAWIGENWTAAL